MIWKVQFSLVENRFDKSMTPVLPVPCPPSSDDPASPKKPTEANAKTRKTNQPGTTAGERTHQGEIS